MKIEMIANKQISTAKTLLVTFVLLFVLGCSANENEEIIGTWAYVANLGDESSIKRVLKFESDGQWENSNFITPKKGANEIFILESGTWSLNFPYLKMVTQKSTVSFDPKNEATLKITKLSSEELVFELDGAFETYQSVNKCPLHNSE